MLKAPTEDGQVLLWPDAAQILTQANQNHDRLASEATAIQNVPLAEIRAALRRQIGIEEAQPVVADGHQTELYHPGVWAKLAVASAAAAKLDECRAVHFAVDVDQPKRLTLRWPAGAAPITDDPRLATAAWCGLLDAPTPAHLQAIQSALTKGCAFHPAAIEFVRTMEVQGPAVPRLSQAITQAMRALDLQLGLSGKSILISSLLDSRPYLVLAHHFLARAPVVAGQYNAALADYRQGHKIRSAMRPMPDLAASADECESPFWLDDQSAATRRRATVVRFNGRWTISAPGGERFAFDESAGAWRAAERLSDFLAAHHLRLSPRAITLTLFLRLLAADQFIHGIGGARYDQVTDALIRSHFRVTPPHYCVATATLYFPVRPHDGPVCLHSLKHEGHQLSHRALGEMKQPIVARIAASPRRSPQRQMLFAQLRDQLSAAAANHPAFKDWEARLSQARLRAVGEKVLFDRELFYAIQPAERLVKLAARCRELFA